jgi:stage VI sporulation protein D
LSQGNQSCLRFSLEESVWFQKGQEVAELVSVSLDPDITIHESDQYVTISGSLKLTGEYRRHEEGVIEEEDYKSIQKYVHAVDERDDGICDFSHRFPVDITIPNNRIQSIYDVNVSVESFDYAFPERSCLKLAAELTISGLYGDQQHEPVEEEEIIEVVYRDRTEEKYEVEDQEEIAEIEVSNEDVYEPFEAEARRRQDESVAEVVNNIPTFNFQETEKSFPAFEDSPDPSFSFVEQRAETQLVPEDVVEEYTEEPEVIIEEPTAEETSPTPEPLPEEDVLPSGEALPSEEETPEPVDEEQAAPLVVTKKKKSSNKKSMSLTEFFARKEEEEEPAKLKVCIVQKGDTLETLSERYEVAVQTLLRVNQLELNQDVHEGQVLYIPNALARN